MFKLGEVIGEKKNTSIRVLTGGVDDADRFTPEKKKKLNITGCKKQAFEDVCFSIVMLVFGGCRWFIIWVKTKCSLHELPNFRGGRHELGSPEN